MAQRPALRAMNDPYYSIIQGEAGLPRHRRTHMLKQRHWKEQVFLKCEDEEVCPLYIGSTIECDALFVGLTNHGCKGGVLSEKSMKYRIFALHIADHFLSLGSMPG